MKIRSITCFCNPLTPDFEKNIQSLAELAQDYRQCCIAQGWEVQTMRLATTPFWHYLRDSDAVQDIQQLEKQSKEVGFNYLSVGPARLSDTASYEIIPHILRATENVFCSAFITHPHTGISIEAIRCGARVIHSAARISPDGFSNLRFSAMSLVPPFTPFFPAAYSYGQEAAFAVAVECADVAVKAFSDASNIQEGRRRLLGELENASARLSAEAQRMASQHHVPFKGLDFSLAPFPQDWCSIGRALENLGVAQIGFMGSLSSAAILAETLDRGAWPRVGFNGLMMPVLEDSILAERSASGQFTIKDLLMYSAVCGTGLDTVPLPGDTSAEKIETLLLDIAALSLRLRKPLTARLMPVPGLAGGEMTHFDFDFFRNSHVMDYPAESIQAPLAASEWIEIVGRGKRA